MSIVWNPLEVAILESIRECATTQEIKLVLESFGFFRSQEAINKKSRILGLAFKTIDYPTSGNLSDDQLEQVCDVLEEWRQDREIFSPEIPTPASQKAANTIAKKNLITSQLQQLQEIREEIPRSSSISIKRARSHKESLVVVMSDTHIGRKVVNLDGEVLFNMEIGLKRIYNTAEIACNLLPASKLNDIDEVVIMLIGDLVDGEGIFPHQELLLEVHAAQQVSKVTKALWKMTTDFKSEFPLVRIVTTKGNHGRSQSSPEANWDNMIFQQLELLTDMTADPNLTICNRYGEYNTVNIKGWKGLLRHKAPVQSDSSGAIAKYAGWHGIHQWDFFCYGHFHHWGVGTWQSKPIFRNGSLMGGDDYSETFGFSDEPTQLMFGVTEDYLPTFVTPIKYPL